MDDLISRQAAIDALHAHLMYRMGTDSNKKRLDDWINGLPSAQETHEERTETHACDCISRQMLLEYIHGEPVGRLLCDKYNLDGLIEQFPSAQPERDIPLKPIETTDRAWGIPSRQAVCPKCDYYLGHVAFLGNYKGKRVTYCETCGQAIDWEGWDFDE